MRSRRNAGIDERPQYVRLRLAALRLHRVRQRLLHEARGVHQRAVDRVVALVRHASQNESIRGSAPNGLRVHDHHVHRGGNCVWVSVRDHRKTVADDRDVDPRHLGPFGRGVVGHRHVDHLFSGPLRLPDFRDGPLFPLFFAVGGGFARNARRSGQRARPRFVLCHGQPDEQRP